MSNTKVMSRLESAKDAARLVRLYRRCKRSDRVDGFVVGIGTKWALLRDCGRGDRVVGMAGGRSVNA